MAKNKFRPNNKGKKSFKDAPSNGSRGKRNKKSFPSKDTEENRSNLPMHDTRGDNDISYWNGAGQLYLDATTLSSYSALGAKHVSPTYTKDYYSPTGICRFDYAPFFGDIRSSVHPINTTAKVIYNAINAKNSRMPSYDPSDLMIYIMAVAQAWSIHAWVRRLCGMFNTFSVVNRYWWEPVCESMGVAPISTDNDIVKWRNLANKMSIVLNRLPVPNGIKYFERTAWMNMNIYMDSPVGKATYYFFSPAAVLKYTYDTDQIGQLTSVVTPWKAYLEGETGAEVVTPKLVENFFNDIISNLFNDSDIPVIGADILKAFDGNIYSIGQIDSSFVLGPIYSPEVNLELHNARVHYGASYLFDSAGSPYRIYQDMSSNTIRSTRVNWDMPAVTSTAFIATDLHGSRAIAIDFPIDNPSNDDWMIATRLCWGAIPPPASEVSNYAILTCGTEILCDDAFYEFQTDSSGDWSLSVEKRCVVPATGTSASLNTQLVNKLSRVSKLHDAPITFVVRNGGSSAQYKEPASMDIVSDLTNYSTLAVEDLANMNDVAQISIFLPEWLKGTVSGK